MTHREVRAATLVRPLRDHISRGLQFAAPQRPDKLRHNRARPAGFETLSRTDAAATAKCSLLTWSVRANSALEKTMLCSKEKRTWSSLSPSL